MNREKTGFINILERMNEFLAQTRIIEINGYKAVLKEYRRESGIIKWFFIKTAGLTTKVYPYTMDPYTRMMRETSFMDKADIINRPHIILKDWIGRVIIREYIEGEHFNPHDLDGYRDLARVFALLHSSGYALGDAKFHNFIRSNNKYYIIDAEQAIETKDYSYMYWDIMVFLITTTYGLIEKHLLNALNIVKKTYSLFLETYLDTSYEETYKILSAYNKFNYRAIAYILLPIPYNIYYVKTIESLI